MSGLLYHLYTYSHLFHPSTISDNSTLLHNVQSTPPHRLGSYSPVTPIPHTSSHPLPTLLLPHFIIHSHYFYYLSFNLYATTPLFFIDNTAKGFLYHVNKWLGIKSMNLLLLSYGPGSVNRNDTIT
jgi:hypothetical protein